MADTIPLRYAQSLLRLARIPPDQLRQDLTEMKLPLVLFQERALPDARISVDDYGRLFIYLVHRLQQELHGAGSNLDGTLRFSAYRMMFQAMLHAGTLEQALQRAAVYFQRLHSGSDGFQVEVDGEHAVCRFHFSDDSHRSLVSPENFSMEQLGWLPGLTGRILSMSMWHRLCGWFVGSFIDLEAVEMRQARTPGRDYAETFDCPVQFGARQDAYRFHSRYLHFPIVQSEASLERLLQTYPAELFRISPGEGSVAGRVRQLIGTDFQRPLPGLPEVAERLHMTAPTLHRRLRDEGTSFQQLKDQCRRDAAIACLTQGDYTTAQLAEMTGFSDSSTFHRAFRKWTGLTPQEYRARHVT